MGHVETGICEQGAVITPEVKAILKQDGGEVVLNTVDEDAPLYAFELAEEDSFSIRVLRTAVELNALARIHLNEDDPELPYKAGEPIVGKVPKAGGGFRHYSIHYQGTASFRSTLNLPEKEEA